MIGINEGCRKVFVLINYNCIRREEKGICHHGKSNSCFAFFPPHEYFLNPICGAISRKHWRHRCMPYLLTMPLFLPQRVQPTLLPNSFLGFTRPPLR